MNLFCVGLSHHNADVEAREYFAGHVESDRALRNCGCNEALVLSTCNRVEVYAACEKRVSTDEIARCLVATTCLIVSRRHFIATKAKNVRSISFVSHQGSI